MIDGKTKTICLIGDPVEHSLSPYLHNMAFQKYNLPYIYINHRVKIENLQNAIKGIKALEYVGANITFPHKIEVIKYLDEITQEAQLINAVNTIKNENGKLIGHNTDGDGFILGLKEQGISLHNKNICILGAGGAAKSIAISISKTEQINLIICNRNIDKAKEIKNTIQKNINPKANINTCNNPKHISMDKIDILINATPVGMQNNQIPFSENVNLHKELILCDLIYQPWETELVKKAKKIGCKIHHGIHMLIGQGLIAFKIWTGIKPEYSLYQQLRQKISQT